MSASSCHAPLQAEFTRKKKKAVKIRHSFCVPGESNYLSSGRCGFNCLPIEACCLDRCVKNIGLSMSLFKVLNLDNVLLFLVVFSCLYIYIACCQEFESSFLFCKNDAKEFQ